LLLVAAGLALFAWDVLPQEHPLRLRLAGEATVPTGMPAPGATGPWYARNELVGSHTYVWHQRLGGEQVDPRKPAGTVRVFVVGGSQAWGSGAASSRETFAEIVERRLRSRGLPVEVFNAAANGGGIRQALALYRELLRLRAPDIVVADVGLNESAGLQRRRDRAGASIAGLAGSLGDLWAACRADGVDGLLALEPMCGETALRPSAALYDALARESARHGVPVARPGDALYAAEPEHFVWWDTAHLAPYGQRLMADALEPELERLVRERPAITDSGVNR
jgi:lysophospholipase L1-like esterase